MENHSIHHHIKPSAMQLSTYLSSGRLTDKLPTVAFLELFLTTLHNRKSLLSVDLVIIKQLRTKLWWNFHRRECITKYETKSNFRYIFCIAFLLIYWSLEYWETSYNLRVWITRKHFFLPLKFSKNAACISSSLFSIFKCK